MSQLTLAADQIAICTSAETLVEALRETSFDLMANIERMASIIRRLDELGAEVDFDHALLPFIRLVSQGKLLGQTLVALSGDPLLLEQAVKAPIEIQQKLAAGDWFDVLQADGEVRKLIPFEMSKKQVLQVFKHGHVRSIDEQRLYLQVSANKSVALKKVHQKPSELSGVAFESRWQSNPSKKEPSDSDPVTEAVSAFRLWQSQYGHLLEVAAIVAAAEPLLVEFAVAEKKTTRKETVNSPEAVEKLFAENKGLVGTVAKKYFKGVDFNEAYEAGLHGLHRAAELFDGRNEFSTYACRTIQGFILRHLKEKRRAIKENGFATEFDKFNEPQTLDRIGDDEELGRHTKTVADIYQTVTASLSEREAEVLRRRSCGQSLESIGEDLGGITKERVRQIETKAMEKAREEAQRSGAAKFYESSLERVSA